MSGPNKLIRGLKPTDLTTSSFQYLKYGEVRVVEDPDGIGRVKLRIKGSGMNGGDDEIKSDNSLPWAHPLLPKHLSVQPKIGEGVWVFVSSKDKENTDRLFMGPVISQPNKLNFDEARTTALAGFTFGPIAPNVNLNTIPELRGIFPNPEDVSIQGRYNTDITQKDNEIVIRAGKFVEKPITNVMLNPYPFIFNTATQGYIQIKNNAIIEYASQSNDTTLVDDTRGTITNIVSNKINLITHTGFPKFNVTNQENLINDDEMKRILSEAHQVGFGDIQLEYLKLLKDAFLNHVHRGNGLKPTDLTSSGNKQALKVFNDKAKILEQSMLSKNIRIN